MDSYDVNDLNQVNTKFNQTDLTFNKAQKFVQSTHK